MTKYRKTLTNRGFKLLQFKDAYEETCDIQESSSITPHIWLGTHSPNPKILASKINPNQTGWTNYELPEEVLISHRMHLNQKQCISLALKLLKFGIFRKL